MSESIVRMDTRRDFTVLQNQMLRDKHLSLKTKGLLAVMLSRPGTWQFSISGLSAFTGAGRDAIRTSLKELREAGYLVLEKQSHGADGKFAGSVYILHEEPVFQESAAGEQGEQPCADFPSAAQPCADFPLTENPTQVNTDLSKDCKNNPLKAPQGEQCVPKRRKNKSIPAWKPERFEGFWAFYPRGEDRVGAVREWDRLKPDDALIDAMARALEVQKNSELWRQGVGIPYACRWLKNRRWEDTPPKTAAGAPADLGDRGWQFVFD